MHSAQSTQTVADGKFRPRPYVGRYVPPPPPEPAREYSVAERITSLLISARWARENAWTWRWRGNEAAAREAFYRAHSYVEMVRELRARL